MKKFIINVASLGFYQGVNLILLIVLVPFYIQTYTIQNFGIINLAQAFGLYILALCDYNFLVTGTRKVTQYIEDKYIIGTLFLESIISKLILFVFGFVVGLIIILLVPNFKPYIVDLSVGMLYGLSLCLLPIWLLQGVQNTKPLAFIHAPIRILGILFIYFFLTKTNDYQWVNVVLLITNIIATVVILIYLYFLRYISFEGNISFHSIRDNLKSGISVCLSNVSVNTYMNLNTLILGVFAGYEVVGIYAVAEKTVIGLRQILSILASVIYPIYCKKINEAKLILKKLIIFTVLGLGGMFSFLITIIYIYNNEIIDFLSKGNSHDLGLSILNILIVSVPIVALNVPFSHFLNASGNENKVAFVSIITVVVSLFLNISFSKYWGAEGTALSVLLTELFCTLSLVVLFYIQFIKYFSISK